MSEKEKELMRRKRRRRRRMRRRRRRRRRKTSINLKYKRIIFVATFIQLLGKEPDKNITS